MFLDEYFTFNDISSKSMGVIACRISTGMVERQYGLNRTLITKKNINNPLPYDFGYETEVIKGELSLTSNDGKLDVHKLAKISEWLYQDDYKPLISNDNPDIVYYVKFVDKHQVNLINDQGYITLSFVCNAPWAWTKPYEAIYDLRNENFSIGWDENGDQVVPKDFAFTLENLGNYDGYNGLEIEVQLYQGEYDSMPDNVYIRNTRNTLINNTFKLNNLIDGVYIPKYIFQNGETIYINMQRQEVETDNELFSSRLNNCNKKWITLERGKNVINVKGRCILKVRCQYPVLI